MNAKYRAVLAVLVAISLLGGIPLYAQEQRSKPESDYSKGRSHLSRNIFGPYAPMDVPEPVLTNSPRVEQLIRDGKLMLSLDDAIALALENNLDISVERYGPKIADTGVLRAKAGLGTPAGSYDPVLTSLFNWDRRSIPINNPFLSGTGTATQTALTNQNTAANMSYSQGFPTGTGYSITFNNTRSSTSSLSTFVNPSVQSSLNFAFAQPLLDGFGFAPGRRALKLARNNKRIADLVFTNQVILTVSSVQNLYWDLVFARNDVDVKQRSVQLAEKLYNDNKRQVEIGTLAPIEVVRAEAEVARTKQELIVAQTFLLQMQTSLKNALTKNSMDPGVLEAEIVPTDTIAVPPDMPSPPLTEAVREAWERRPDVRQAQVDLDNRVVTAKASRNAMLPSLTFSGQFGGTGLAGNRRLTTSTQTGFSANVNSPVVDATGNPVLVGGVPVFAGTPTFSTVTTLQQAGFSDAFGTVKDFSFPNYSVQFNLNIPIRNRAAQADNAQAILEHRQSEERLRQLQNTIVVEVHNALIALEQNRARVVAAQKSRELQERTLDAEQKKYQLGASTIFFVIQAQRDLAQSQSAEVRALADLLKSRVEYERALGRTLETNKIDIADARNADVRVPHIPGTVVAQPVPRSAKF